MTDRSPVDSSPDPFVNNPDSSPMVATFKHDGSGQPSRTRFVVLIFLAVLAAILYLDRVCLGQAQKPIQDSLGIDNTMMGYVHMAFTLAYGLFEIPAGRWGDRAGSRLVLTRICLWWSGFTALTGACFDFASLMVVRFLFGAGEAGAFPNSARILSRWFPDHERGRVQGVLLTASHIGAVLSPFVAAWLIKLTGWRTSFVVFGAVGAVWSAAFYMWFRDDPNEHPDVNHEERSLIGKGSRKDAADHRIPWELVLSTPSILLLCLTMALASFNSYLYISWYSTYLQKARDVTNLQAGSMTSCVMAGAAIGTLIGGFLIDRYIRGRSVWVYRLFGGTAYIAATLLLWTACRFDDVWTFVLFTSCSYALTQMIQPLWWTVMIAASGRNVGALFGLCNMCGMFGAMTSQYLVGTMADHRIKQGLTGRAAWDPMFAYFFVVLLCGAACWYAMRTEPVADGDKA